MHRWVAGGFAIDIITVTGGTSGGGSGGQGNASNSTIEGVDGIDAITVTGGQGASGRAASNTGTVDGGNGIDVCVFLPANQNREQLPLTSQPTNRPGRQVGTGTGTAGNEETRPHRGVAWSALRPEASTR